MRITVVTGGTRGDVQPLVALGLGLKERGHRVRVLAYPPFEGLIRERGLDFGRLSGDPRVIVKQVVEAGLNPVRFMRCLREIYEPIMAANFEETLLMCKDADAILYTPVGFSGFMVAEALGTPAVGAGLQPLFSRTRYFPSSMAPLPVSPGGKGSGGLYNLLSYAFPEQYFWQMFRGAVNRLRREKLGLRPVPVSGPFRQMRAKRMPVLYGYSPSVIPHPADWGGHLHTTGFWFLDQAEGWNPPPELLRFLEEGPPPVAVGFGSVIRSNMQEIVREVLEGVMSAGRRAVFLKGWSGVSAEDLPGDVLVVDEVPHDWLLPRVAAAVHHASAGSSGAAFRAGIPQIPVPFNAEERFWARRISSLGVGSGPIMGHDGASAERVARAVSAVLGEDAVGARAARLGATIRAEDGVGAGVAAFERHVRA